MGVVEIVEKFLKIFPMAIHLEDSEMKNGLMLAIENKHPKVYEVLQQSFKTHQSIFHKVDADGNNALHFAATRGGKPHWHISSPALQMQWDIKWFKVLSTSAFSRMFPK